MANGTVDTSDASVFGTRSVIYTNDWQKLYCGPADDSDPNSCADPGLERFSGDVLSVGFLPEISNFVLSCVFWNKTDASGVSRRCNTAPPDGHFNSGFCFSQRIPRDVGIYIRCIGWPVSNSTQSPVSCPTATLSKNANVIQLEVCLARTSLRVLSYQVLEYKSCFTYYHYKWVFKTTEILKVQILKINISKRSSSQKNSS